MNVAGYGFWCLSTFMPRQPRLPPVAMAVDLRASARCSISWPVKTKRSTFSIGLPDFDVPRPAKKPAIEPSAPAKTAITPTQGLELCRVALRPIVGRDGSRRRAKCWITSAVSGGLMLAILATIDPGDEGDLPRPLFRDVQAPAPDGRGKSVNVRQLPDFRFPPEKVEHAITARTKR